MQDLFGDQQLDSDLAMILNLQSLDPAASVGPLSSSAEIKKRSVHQSHTASVTIAVALGLFVIASSALLLRNRVPNMDTRPTSVSPSPHPAADVRPALLPYPDPTMTQTLASDETADVSDRSPSHVVSVVKPHLHAVRWASSRLGDPQMSSAASQDVGGVSVTDVAQPDETRRNPPLPALADALPSPVFPSAATSEGEKSDQVDDVVRTERRRESISAIRNLRRQ